MLVDGEHVPNLLRDVLHHLKHLWHSLLLHAVLECLLQTWYRQVVGRKRKKALVTLVGSVHHARVG